MGCNPVDNRQDDRSAPDAGRVHRHGGGSIRRCLHGLAAGEEEMSSMAKHQRRAMQQVWRVKECPQAGAKRCANRDAAHKKLQEIRTTSESARQNMQAGMDAAWASMKNALDKASSQFKK